MNGSLITHGTITEHALSVHSLARRPACPRIREHGAWSMEQGTREQLTTKLNYRCRFNFRSARKKMSPCAVRV